MSDEKTRHKAPAQGLPPFSPQVPSIASTSSSSSSSTSTPTQVHHRLGEKTKIRERISLANIIVPVSNSQHDSYHITPQKQFVSGDLIIDEHGIKEKERESEVNDRGIKLDDIEMLDVIGRGNSAVVHLARHVPTGKMMAVKVINILDREKRHQILKELRALYQAKCPYLIDFYGAFYKDPSVSLAMEYMDCGSLQSVLNNLEEKTVPEPIVAILARQIIEGVAYMHKKHQIHRDIKPSNICLSSKGYAKLTDFGIAAELSSSLAMCETFVGTYSYMSPERIRGGEYSYKSDIWAVGLVLLQCALGKFPYPHNGIYIDLMQLIVSGPPPEIPQNYSEGFQSFVKSCLQVAPEKRPTAQELLDAPWISQLIDAEVNQQALATWLQRVVVVRPKSHHSDDGHDEWSSVA